MSSSIQRVAVIGSGVMGSGIAAHVANAGVPVLLLDLPQSGWGQKNALAQNAIDTMLKADPCPFMSQQAAKQITPGNLDDDFDQLASCDWIIEVIVEKLEIKQDLYRRIDQIKAPDAIVSSNTSTIPLKRLIEGQSLAFQQHFLITHFFNPPRYMRLLEMIKGPETLDDVAQKLDRFCDINLGKSVVYGEDTPGFIGNRIGIFWLLSAMVEAIDQGITVEETDALFGKAMGIPKTGVFGLMDLVGLDLIPLIGQSMKANLSLEDAYTRLYREPDILKKMLAEGYTGRKGKGGFYRINRTSDNKVKESIDLKTGDYHPTQNIKLPALDASGSDLKALLSYPDRHGQFAWRVLSQVLSYTASLVPEISSSPVDIDTAMKLGFNWKFGPFELLDKIGVKWFVDKMQAEGREVPPFLTKVIEVGQRSFYRLDAGQLHYFTPQGNYQAIVRPQGQLWLSDIKRRSKPILSNGSASLWDIGDHVACLEFQSKMNTIDGDIMAMIRETIQVVSKDFKALVIYNEGTHFSAGANIGMALFTANIAMWPAIYQMVAEGQQIYKALKYSSFPVVSAPTGLALGGGCEILLHSDAIQAHAESYIGLVEVGVGLIPAWGGCKELSHRWLHEDRQFGGSLGAISKVFETIGTAKVAKSAAEAKDLRYLRPSDAITMNRDRLLADAKIKALSLIPGYQPPTPPEFSLPGATARVALSMAVKALVLTGKATTYDAEISRELAFILTGGEADITEKVTEDQLYALELKAFMTLVKNPKTLARIEHMLETGKPLRN
ncbi:MAG: 3-hydroxyacyl-CoA dehydrogenase NAD-binding domain-containing protein [Janthinobacterium lividum]